MHPYWLRAIALLTASFALTYIALSALSSLAWVAVRSRRQHSSGFLFTLLAAPLLASLALVFFFVLPAFLLLEPRGSHEPITWTLRAFAALGTAIFATAITRAARAWTQTLRSVRLWSANAIVSDREFDLPILATSDSSPAVVVTGIARPMLLISRRTSAALSANELRLVVAHEREHARRRDNLRKLLFSANFMFLRREIEDRWVLSSELEADRAAVSNGAEACDLAAALVKVSRLTFAQTPLATNFAAANPAMLEMRVQQLISWQATTERGHNIGKYLLTITTIGGTAILVANSAAILSFVHRVSELWMN